MPQLKAESRKYGTSINTLWLETEWHENKLEDDHLSLFCFPIVHIFHHLRKVFDLSKVNLWLNPNAR